MRAVFDIGKYNWGSVTYVFFIAFLRRASQWDFRSLEGCWQILTWWAYEYIPALRPRYSGLLVIVYPQAYAWALCAITRVIVVQPVTIFIALDCVIWDEMIVYPYHGSQLGWLELTIAMG